MSERSYWLDLFTVKTWQEFQRAGATVSGFREQRWATVQRITPGDYLLCYLTGVSRFIGVLEVMGKPYQDSSRIWDDEAFPCRVPVRIIVALSPETAVPIVDLRDELSIFNDLTRPNAWTGRVRGSPARWKGADGEAIVNALRSAEQNPVIRPVERTQLERRPKAVKSKIGPVTVPDADEPEMGGTGHDAPTRTMPAGHDAEQRIEPSTEPTAHTEIQWLLLKLGSDMGLNVWVARNDRNREANGHRFAEVPKLMSQLPRQFDEATTKTIELIDVLWLKGTAIVAAFEIESTTSIYSGLLRMSDLIAMQPNLSIPLFIVAPDDRREKVISEINRPTFARLLPPMAVMCRFISFTTLREHLSRIAPFVRYLKPDVLEEMSESCEAEEA